MYIYIYIRHSILIRNLLFSSTCQEFTPQVLRSCRFNGRIFSAAMSMAFWRFDTQLMCFSASLSGDLKAEIHVMCIAAKWYTFFQKKNKSWGFFPTSELLGPNYSYAKKCDTTPCFGGEKNLTSDSKFTEESFQLIALYDFTIFSWGISAYINLFYPILILC